MPEDFDKDVKTEVELEEDDFSPELLTLVDEDGEEHQFEMVDSAEFEGGEYMALIPVFEDPQELLDDSGQLVILKLGEDNDEQFLEAIEDEDEFKRVGDFFVKRLEDVYDFED